MVTRRLDHEIFGMLNKAIEETAITYLPTQYINGIATTVLIVSTVVAEKLPIQVLHIGDDLV